MWYRIEAWWSDYRETRHRHRARWWASLSPTQRAEWRRWRRDGWIMAAIAGCGLLLLLLARIATPP
jgi:hypothetical protein